MEKQKLNDNSQPALQQADVMRASFWFMRDNQTFCKPNGENLDEIKANLLQIAKENPHGMVCPVIILQGEEKREIRRVGVVAHVDDKGNVDLSKWYEEIIKDDVVRSYNGV